jgi:uncharacterized protein YuzB (UPF0349 family)
MKPLFQKLFPSKKKIQIAFCQKNLDRHLDQEMTLAFSEFLQHPQIEYKEYECLSKCTSCQLSPYALINGHYIEASHMNDLLQHIKSQVRPH